MQLIAFAQPGQEGHHVVLADLADRGTAALDQDVDVAAQVTPVGAQRVRGETTFDREMVEVRADLGPQRSSELFTGGGYQRGTSSRRVVAVRGHPSGASGARRSR
jgi:hypothetical protein